MKATRHAILFSFVLLAASAVAFMLFAAWSVSSPAVDLADLERLHCGMTKAEVESLFGRPYRESAEGAGAQWTYGHPLKWYQLRIDFGRDGQVVRYVHDD